MPDTPIEVGVLKEVDPSVVGLLDDPHGGLGIQMWDGTPRSRVEMLLPRLPMGTFSPVMQDLSSRLLLTTAVVPVGTPIAPSLLGLRVERLMAGGRIDEVNELLRIAATPVNDPALSRAEIDARLLAGDYAGACQKIPGLVQVEPAPHWFKTLAFCRALERDTAAVTLATALLRDQAVAEGTAVVAIVGPDQLALVGAGVKVDDFVLVPIDEAELRVRLSRLIFDRTGQGDGHVIRHGGLVIDLERYKVTVDEEVVDLTYKEYELLRFLSSNPGKPFTREALLNQVWGYDYYGGSRTVDVHVRRLRKKLPLLSTALSTIKQFGYKLLDSPDADR